MATTQEIIGSFFWDDKTWKNVKPWNLGTSLTKFIAQDSANKLDSKEQLINGVSVNEFFGDEIKLALAKSKFVRRRKQLGKKLSLNGKSALVVDMIDGSPFISLSEIANYIKVAGELVEYWGNTGRVYEEDKGEYPVYERWYLENGRVKKYFGWVKGTEWFLENPEQEPYTYPANITHIPVQIFENNEDAVSDVENTGMWDAIEELNYHAGQMNSEWKMTKTAFIRNAMFGANKDAKTFEKEKGENGVINATSPDGQLGNVLQPLISGSQTNLINQANINFIEDKILKYTFTTRDSTSTGTNKHNSEIATFNQFAIEYLQDKREIRQEDYAHFYAILKMFEGQAYNPMDIKVEIQISELVENLIKSSNPETPEVQESTNINKDAGTTEEEK